MPLIPEIDAVKKCPVTEEVRDGASVYSMMIDYGYDAGTPRNENVAAVMWKLGDDATGITVNRLGIDCLEVEAPDPSALRGCVDHLVRELDPVSSLCPITLGPGLGRNTPYGGRAVREILFPLPPNT